ncbi:MAG: GEVED domain-containing protein [Crocinitomicaceae bacterium]|nr:GEVED domain-containing protein [Crocinitomicaceae bacterium]
MSAFTYYKTLLRSSISAVLLFLFNTQNIFSQFCNNGTTSENITITETTQTTTAYSNGRRVFEFDATAGNTYEFATCNTSTGDTKLRLYASATGGTQLEVSDNDCGANGKQSEIIWLCPTTGTYALLLTKKDCKNLNFSASVRYFMTVPDACSEVTLNVNAGNALSLCNGSNTVLNASATLSYNDGNYSHCASAGNMDFTTAITNFSFNGETTINNSSAKTQAYTDYSGTIIGEALAGSSYANGLSMRINSAGNWTILGTVWFDWNRNDIFEDSEAYQMGSTTNSTDGITSLSPLSITVPSNTTPGYIKVRTACKWDGDGIPLACETGYDGEVEDYAILITSPLSYSWSPATNINNTSLLNPNCSATTNTTYDLTVSTNNGCIATDNINITVETPPSITSSSNVTGIETCGEISITVQTDAADGSGSWSHSNGLGLFSSPTDASTTFTTNTFNSSQNLTWTSSLGACAGSTAEINALFNQPNTSNLTDLQESTSWLWGGLANDQYSEASNWYKWDGFKWLRETSSTPGNTDKIYVQSNNESGLCVSASSSLTISSNIESLFISDESNTNLEGNITISGNIENNGLLNASSGSLTINGVGNQELNGTGSTSLNNLILNKTSGNFVMNAPLTVAGNLNLTSGIIQNSDNILTIGVSSSAEGSLTYTEGRISGKLRRYFGNGNNDVLFPVGDALNTRKVSINIQGNPGTDQYLTISYISGYAQSISGNLTNGLPLITSDDQLIDNVSGDGYWEIMPTNGDYSSTINNKTYTISLQGNNINGVTDFVKTRIIKSAGSNTPSENHIIWSAPDHLNASGTNSDFTLIAQGSGFSYFTIGGSDSNALPVELTSFTGECNQGGNILAWQTSSEYNSSHFVVEWSRDGMNWEAIEEVTAAGFSNEVRNYTVIHETNHTSYSYYRLSQFDIDGENEIFSNQIIELSCGTMKSQDIQVFPNPNNGNFNIQFYSENPSITTSKMTIFNARGSVVYEKVFNINSGIHIISINENLKKGFYVINLEMEGIPFQPKRFIVN